MKNIDLSRSQELLLDVIRDNSGTLNVSQVLRRWRVKIRNDRVGVDFDDLPGRHAIDYHLGLLEVHGFIKLVKQGDSRQAHVFPEVVEDFFQKYFGLR